MSAYDVEAAAFHQANPEILDELRTLALQAVREGRRVGVRCLWEKVRWNRSKPTTDTESTFKLNDHYHSWYARKLMEERELAGVFELRGRAEPAPDPMPEPEPTPARESPRERLPLFQGGPMLRALTLHRPWSNLIALGIKKVENRTWAPPQSLIGQWLAIHAGATFDEDGERWARQQLTDVEDDVFVLAEDRPQQVVALALLEHVVDRERPATLARLPADQRRWKNSERFGWCFCQVVRLATPVPCAGRQGLWQVPRQQEELVLRQVPDYVRLMLKETLRALPGIAL